VFQPSPARLCRPVPCLPSVNMPAPVYSRPPALRARPPTAVMRRHQELIRDIARPGSPRQRGGSQTLPPPNRAGGGGRGWGGVGVGWGGGRCAVGASVRREVYAERPANHKMKGRTPAHRVQTMRGLRCAVLHRHVPRVFCARPAQPLLRSAMARNREREATGEAAAAQEICRSSVMFSAAMRSPAGGAWEAGAWEQLPR